MQIFKWLYLSEFFWKTEHIKPCNTKLYRMTTWFNCNKFKSSMVGINAVTHFWCLEGIYLLKITLRRPLAGHDANSIENFLLIWETNYGLKKWFKKVLLQKIYFFSLIRVVSYKTCTASLRLLTRKHIDTVALSRLVLQRDTFCGTKIKHYLLATFIMKLANWFHRNGNPSRDFWKYWSWVFGKLQNVLGSPKVLDLYIYISG